MTITVLAWPSGHDWFYDGKAAGYYTDHIKDDPNHQPLKTFPLEVPDQSKTPEIEAAIERYIEDNRGTLFPRPSCFDD